MKGKGLIPCACPPPFSKCILCGYIHIYMIMCVLLCGLNFYTLLYKFYHKSHFIKGGLVWVRTATARPCRRVTSNCGHDHWTCSHSHYITFILWRTYTKKITPILRMTTGNLFPPTLPIFLSIEIIRYHHQDRNITLMSKRFHSIQNSCFNIHECYFRKCNYWLCYVYVTQLKRVSSLPLCCSRQTHTHRHACTQKCILLLCRTRSKWFKFLGKYWML